MVETSNRETCSRGRRKQRRRAKTRIVGTRREIPVSRSTSILIPIFVISLIIPLSIHVGPIRLSPYRASLLLALLPAITMLATGKSGKIYSFDILMFLFALWGAVSLLVTTGVTAGIEPAGIFFIETLGPYLLARAYVRDSKSFLSMVKTAYLILLILIPFAIFESLTNRPIILENLGRLFSVFEKGNITPRFGLYRSQVVFEHPILYGAFASSLLGLCIYVIRVTPGFVFGKISPFFVCLASVFSVSTGAVAALVFQSALITWDYLTKRVSGRWLILILGFVVVYTLIDLLSNRTPFHVLVTYLTFSSHSSYTRILIFEYGFAEVLRHPVFGIGFAEWQRPGWMPSSIDNYWLVLAIRHGLPALVFFVVAIIFAFLKICRAKTQSIDLINIRKGILISLLGLFVGGCTVHYWNALGCWLIFLFGSGVWIIEAAENRRYSDLDREELTGTSLAKSRERPSFRR